MGTLNDVVINKLSGGLGRREPSQDMVSGLLFDGDNVFEVKKETSLSSGVFETSLESVDASLTTPENLGANDTYKQLFETETLYRLASLDDAEGLGITAAYDVDGQSAYYQIQQYFRMNPSGDLFIMAVSKNADDSAFESYSDVVGFAKDMQVEAEGTIRQMAVIYSGETNIDQTKSAVLAAQTQAGEAYDLYMPFEVLLEGKGFDASKVSVTGADKMPNLDESGAENVSVVVAMDAEKALTYTNTAAVGVALGAVSRAKVSENIAWVEKFNLTGEGFAKVGFVGGTKLATSGDAKTLNDMRYVFARKHVGYPGMYFNDSHTATAGTSDFAYVENNRTINKATRLLRTALVTKIASPVLIDGSTGELPLVVSKDFETLCRVALEGMVSNEEVSQFDVYVDPRQNILATSELRIKAEIVPVGIARKIMVDLGFKNPFGIDKA